MNQEILFIDTSALIALLDARDQNHGAIKSYIEGLDRPLRGITSNLVLGELLTFFSRCRNPDIAISFQKQVLNDKFFKVVWIDRKLHLESMAYLKKYSDHEISFADAASFALMKKHRIGSALTFDTDFKKAGFRMVP